MKTTKIDFNEVTYSDLEGNTFSLPEQFIKDFANKAYTTAPTIDIAELATKIFHSQKKQADLILDPEELSLLINVFDNVRLLGYPVHKATKMYLETRLNELTNKLKSE
ncbi:hypothetical protein [Pedobacter nyackensis]|uniref:Uncharacterized protein n=1 Tax=Pedobacter nyackensis TaxID=475255 RepID=A0A1W1ZYX3_9SPHI|nr:hypothetical protein [Pedobacter nyackensis]SMC53402.1 hypothetical protein SAMN04488101_101154 [Pedobacter nyackensis]